MAHFEQTQFFHSVFDTFPEIFKTNSGFKIIDFGSLNINGGPHDHIVNTQYVGVDLGPGPNVDLVSPGELVDLPSLSFDAAISSECFEHNPFWKETFMQMCRLTKPNSIVAFTCAGIGRKEHGTSRSDNGTSAPLVVEMGREYYHNVSKREVLSSLNVSGWFDSYFCFENFKNKDTYFMGIRSGSDSVYLERFNQLGRQLEIQYSANAVEKLRTTRIMSSNPNLLRLYFFTFRWFFRLQRFKEEGNKKKKILRITLGRFMRNRFGQNLF
jgi:SAM-dependent methyltransferase